MIAQSDVLILKAGRIPELQLIDELNRKGFEVRITDDFTAAPEICKYLANPIIVCFSTSEPQTVEIQVDLLANMQEIHEVPLLLVCKDALSYTRRCADKFELLLTLNTPCKPGEIVEQVVTVSRNLVEARYESERYLDEETKDESERIPSEVIRAPSKDQLIVSFFAQSDEFDFTKRQSGKNFVYFNKLNISKDDLLPNDHKTRMAVEEFVQAHSQQVHAHIKRTTFMAKEVLDVTQLVDQQHEQAIRTASCLFGWTANGHTHNLLTGDYTNKATSVRKDLASTMEQSAHKIRTELKSESAGDIVMTMSKLLSQQRAPDTSEDSLAASLVIGMDLMDRICWGSGHWNPNHAYRLVRQCMRGDIEHIHHSVVFSIIKIMANAFESSLSVHQLPRPKRDEPRAEPEGALKERIHRKVQAGESKVTLSALQPGMRLMRPVVSTDGTLLLPENVVLDDDIIWKLWRLAAIKPLYTPVCVVEG